MAEGTVASQSFVTELECSQPLAPLHGKGSSLYEQSLPGCSQESPLMSSSCATGQVGRRCLPGF